MAAERTIPLYYEDCNATECQSKVISVEEASTDKVRGCYSVVLNKTIYYPQGGGQPNDVGVMVRTGDSIFKISDTQVIRDTGVILHFGHFSGPVFSVGDSVTVKIDAQRRLLHSRLHTGGHLIDACLKTLGFMDKWKPVKGHHFPEGPYVEYRGEISDSELSTLKEELEEKAKELIAENTSVNVYLNVNLEEAQQMCGQLDHSYLKMGKLRLVSINDCVVPCGGTHVGKLGQLIDLKIPKIKSTKAKQLIRIYYKLA